MPEKPIQPPPPREGLTSEGFVTRVWYRWMQSVAKMVFRSEDLEAIVAAGGYDIQKEAVYEQRIDELQKRFESMLVQDKSYLAQIDELRKIIYTDYLVAKTNYEAELGDLRKLIAISAFQIGGVSSVYSNIALISVVDIDSPTELGSYKGAEVGSILIAYKVEAATDQHIIYAWDEADTGGASAPYVMAGSSGFWVAIGGKYIANNSRFNALTASLIVISDANKGLGSLAKQAHIADASTAHAVADFAGTNTALDALGTKINAILSALETALILNTA